MAQEAAGAPPKVLIAAAYAEEVTREANFIGRGEATAKTDLVARVSGFVTEVVVRDGTNVSEGDLLFRIDPGTYEAAVAAKEAALKRAEASLALAGIELIRAEQLVSRDAVAESELDIARANSAVAEADLAAAQAALDLAELDLEYTEIRAPFDGRFGKRMVSVGALVSPNTGPLGTLVTQSPMYVTFSLSEPQFVSVLQQLETDVEGLRDHERSPNVFFSLPNGTDLDETGKIVFLDNRIDPATGTIALRAEVPNARRLILDGGFVTVRIESLEPTPSILVPQGALQRDQRGDFVLVVTDQQMVEQRYVTLGDQVDNTVIVEDGLRSGEAVIVEGLQRVRPGAEVNAVLAAQSGEN